MKTSEEIKKELLNIFNKIQLGENFTVEISDTVLLIGKYSNGDCYIKDLETEDEITIV